MSTISLKICEVTTDRTVFVAVILFWSPQDGATGLSNTVAQTSGHQLTLTCSHSAVRETNESCWIPLELKYARMCLETLILQNTRALHNIKKSCVYSIFTFVVFLFVKDFPFVYKNVRLLVSRQKLQGLRVKDKQTTRCILR